jgi:hypothetical protein
VALTSAAEVTRLRTELIAASCRQRRAVRAAAVRVARAERLVRY